MVYRLSSILRRLLRKTDNLTPLREEMAFIDNYMTIEMVRFGEKLRFVKEIDAETLDRLVPSMMLQPHYREQHPARPEQQSGWRHDPRAQLAGGWPAAPAWWRTMASASRRARLAPLFEQGIGVSNVNERLKVLFGQDYRMWIDSKPGEGTRTGIEIPELQVISEAGEEVQAAG